MSKYIQPILFTVYGAALAYVSYKVLKQAWDNPPEVDDDSRKLILGYDEDGTPIFDPECDVDKTLEMWREQSRLVRQSM